MDELNLVEVVLEVLMLVVAINNYGRLPYGC